MAELREARALRPHPRSWAESYSRFYRKMLNLRPLDLDKETGAHEPHPAGLKWVLLCKRLQSLPFRAGAFPLGDMLGESG